ncbi:MAG TPA: IPT/TIG domain-containing protein, partial [Flavitalea sp.]|nr:IPT/TIG domain-containing protein [Flavitalea sp.]
MKNQILSVALLFLCVNVFASPPVGTITSFSPSTASTGTTVIITGTGLSLTTSVKFGNVQAASFTIISGTQVNAVVPAGSSGSIEMIISGITVSKAGFLYLRTSGIITDFNGYWKTSDLNVNPVNPDNSHNMLAFTVDGITYSTGVKQYILDNNSIVYTPGNFKALPVAGISGSNTGIGVYIALAKNKDGSSGVANTAAVSDYSISKSLTDGENGLDLGTGITNLPASADLTFQIFSIDPAKISDAEPDLILTQIASPSAGNDIFSLVDASGTIVGNTKTQDMFDLPQLGTYLLDLFNITPNVAYDKGKVYSASSTGSREIRIAAFKLSDFGITAGNAAQVRALKIAPSSTSDYAFIAYNVNSINLPPNVTRSNAGTNENICGGGTSMLEVIASPSAGGVLSYVWEELAPAASDWTILTESAKYIAVNSNRLTVINPDNNAKYRVRVTETGNTNTALSPEFSITVIAPSPPTSVTIAGGSSICLNSPSQLTSSVAGGTTRFYQWQQNISGTFQNIDGANQDSYAPVINQTGSFVYRLLVSGANGCTAVTSNSATVTISGIASTTPTAVCTG